MHSTAHNLTYGRKIAQLGNPLGLDMSNFGLKSGVVADIRRINNNLKTSFAQLPSNILKSSIALKEWAITSIKSLNSCRLDTKGNPNLLSSETVKIWQYTSSSLGVFYTAQEVTLAKDVVVYKDTELSEELATIVAVDTSGLTISFGTIETLSEYEDEPLHYSATNYGDFYVKESLVLGAECFSDADCTQLMGVVTFLNLTRISIGEVETYTFDGNQTTHIYITANAPFTYTTATSKTHHVEKNLVLDVIDLCPDDSSTKNFNLFVNHESDGYCLVALSNTIFTQMLEPTDYQANDIWFKILEPLASYIYLLNIWQETNLVPVGVFTLEGGEK